MNRKLRRIINKYKSPAIEDGLVQLFVEKNNLSVVNNQLIKTILSDTSAEVDSAKQELERVINSEDIVEFVNTFELLVPSEDKKLNGAFYTPKNITDFMVGESIATADQKVCDPSCGCGAFLISAAEYMAQQFKLPVVDVIENNLFGVDIAEYSVRRAKILLSLLALVNGEDVEEIKFNLEVADSLSTDWQQLFNTKFDVVIGNPPYVKFQDLPLKLRKQLNTEWKTLKTGNYNLYFAFFELGVDLMKEDGVLVYITPNNYFTSLAGVPLRQYLATNKLIEKIIDFNHLRLFAAQTYTCITKLNKIDKNYFSFERVDEENQLDNLEDLNYSKIAYKDLNNKKWRLLRQEDQQNIKKIEQTGNKLGAITDIKIGVATCKDSVYFIDGQRNRGDYYLKTYNGKDYEVEKEVTKPIAKISDFKNQSQLNDNTRKIIFPYKNTDGKSEIIPETKFKQRYPKCYEYLLAAKAELKTRDKGKGDYPEWYAYARTQGLNFFGKKLLTPTFSAEPRFLMETGEDTLFCNGYAVYPSEDDNLFAGTEQKLSLKLLRKILNSSVMDYYVTKTSVSIQGGYPCYQKNFIEPFGVPEFSDADIEFLEKTTDQAEINEFLEQKYEIDI